MLGGRAGGVVQKQGPERSSTGASAGAESTASQESGDARGDCAKTRRNLIVLPQAVNRLSVPNTALQHDLPLALGSGWGQAQQQNRVTSSCNASLAHQEPSYCKTSGLNRLDS